MLVEFDLLNLGLGAEKFLTGWKGEYQQPNRPVIQVSLAQYPFHPYLIHLQYYEFFIRYIGHIVGLLNVFALRELIETMEQNKLLRKQVSDLTTQIQKQVSQLSEVYMSFTV